MSRRASIVIAVLGLSALFVWAQDSERFAESIQRVFVTNFPEVQEVRGRVSVVEPVRLAKLVRFEDVLVPPVRPTETTRLVDAGVLATEGFPQVVLSLHGQVKGTIVRSGEVGVILVPDQEVIRQAFDELGLVHFALRAAATGVATETAYFASNQPKYPVAFQGYRVLMYNTTDKTVSANLFAYLTN